MQKNLTNLKGIVHFEIYFWCVSAYLKGIQDVDGGEGGSQSVDLKKHAQRSQN